ncbi:SIMPL domain-containing protein [Nocardioides sp. zg-536]|uniref:SIMPL domain-containing protein n=1 Tax=Nocardioides faecalis TaxID=2803858 RepID=A0A939BVP3_9ACTN|nr:SIMPL domain-containing protein [Nocardioides faecalis]MBM9459762.1 SIMPL domain-containing protein [Nocardioides faecalis]QVI58277.1 SIMPL domain-containing protein [Nocardioides faecalis]
MPTEVVVRGSYAAFQRPERGTVRATLALEGPTLQPVYDQVVASLEAVRGSVKQLHDPEAGPVTWWSTQQVRTWARRPWNNEGKQLPLVHHASVGLEVKFRDFTELTRWVGRHVVATPGFALDGVAWALTEKRRAELERTVRTRAVQDAARRAQEYADALGLGPVRPVAIADAGMLGEGIAPTSLAAVAFSRASAGKESGGVELQLTPEDIKVAADVDARFVAGG